MLDDRSNGGAPTGGGRRNVREKGAPHSFSITVAMAATTLLLASAALHAAVMVNTHASRNAARHAAIGAADTLPVHLAALPRSEPVEDDVADAAALPVLPAAQLEAPPAEVDVPAEFVLASLAPLEPPGKRALPWLGPTTEERLSATLPRMALERPLPWIGPPPEDIVTMLPALPDLGTRLPPTMPPPLLLEPHMEAREDWIIRSWLHRNPGIQRVRFMPNVQARCLPSSLLRVLYDAAMRFGEVRVISGYRSPSHNRRVGGASRSLHIECRAIDFYIPGPGHGVLAFLTSRKEVGGYKRYPFGSYHIDNGPRRTWGWSSRRGKAVRVASARR